MIGCLLMSLGEEKKKTLPPFRVEESWILTQKVEGIELINRTQIGEKSSSLGGSERKSKAQ